MKKMFEKPKMRIDIFECEDVVTSSGGGTGVTAEEKAQGLLNNNGVTNENTFKIVL